MKKYKKIIDVNSQNDADISATTKTNQIFI